MSDNVAITAGLGTSIATDDCGAGGHVQVMKLAISTDGSATLITADSKGLKVQQATAADLQVTATLAAGTAAYGKLSANSGVDIGDVDVTSIIPGTAATNLGKAEDAGHTTGDVGVMVLGVRNDADAPFGADLDYTPQSTDAGGNTNVRVRAALKKINVQSGGLTTTATAYTAGDQVGTIFTFAGAARASGGGGYITGAMLKTAADGTGAFDLVLCNATHTLASDNAAYAISDGDALLIEAYIQLASFYDIGNNRIAFANNLRIPYVCAATSLFGGLITRSAIAATPFAAATDIDLTLYVELA